MASVKNTIRATPTLDHTKVWHKNWQHFAQVELLVQNLQYFVCICVILIRGRDIIASAIIGYGRGRQTERAGGKKEKISSFINMAAMVI